MVLHDALHAVAQLCCGAAAFGVAEKSKRARERSFVASVLIASLWSARVPIALGFSPLRMTCRRSPDGRKQHDPLMMRGGPHRPSWSAISSRTKPAAAGSSAPASLSNCRSRACRVVSDSSVERRSSASPSMNCRYFRYSSVRQCIPPPPRKGHRLAAGVPARGGRVANAQTCCSNLLRYKTYKLMLLI